jgi:hypothetical protein
MVEYMSHGSVTGNDVSNKRGQPTRASTKYQLESLGNASVQLHAHPLPEIEIDSNLSTYLELVGEGCEAFQKLSELSNSDVTKLKDILGYRGYSYGPTVTKACSFIPPTIDAFQHPFEDLRTVFAEQQRILAAFLGAEESIEAEDVDRELGRLIMRMKKPGKIRAEGGRELMIPKASRWRKQKLMIPKVS